MMKIKVLILLLKEKLRRFIKPRLYAELEQQVIHRSQFYKLFINSNDLVFDIGANLGNRIEPMLRIGARVVAAEPQSFCHNYLKLRYGKKINLAKCGIGSVESTATLHLNSNATTIASISEEWIDSVKNGRFRNMVWAGSEQVKIITLMKLIETYGIPKFIKIDVEGYKYEVLKGLTTAPELTGNAVNCLERLNQLDPHYRYNYSVGENNRFELPGWLSYEKMHQLVERDTEKLRGFGDIYASRMR